MFLGGKNLTRVEINEIIKIWGRKKIKKYAPIEVKIRKLGSDTKNENVA